jgi:hypothetical protein
VTAARAPYLKCWRKPILEREDFHMKRSQKFLLLTMAMAALYLLSGCAVTSKVLEPPIRPAPDYDRLFPYYVEICAVSQIQANFAKHGGSPGHAVMYLKGVCRDDEAGYPRLKLCDPETEDLTVGETGTGVSVNKMLKNVNWLAIPGKELFFRGNLQADEVLDADRAISTIYDAEKAGVFEGVEVHGTYLPPEDDEEKMLYLAAAETMGTDFALTFGRSVYCARLPMDRPVIEKVAGYLNDLNDEYASGKAEYNWSGYSDNCAHALHNALAAAWVWRQQAVRTTKLLQFFNLSIPANEFANLAFRSSSEKYDDPWVIFTDPVLNKSLLEQNWLPTRHGALLKHLPVHPNNELFGKTARILVLELPILRPKSNKIGKMYRNPRHTELLENLRWFRSRYERILEGRPKDLDPEAPEGTFPHFQQRYYRYIEEQLKDVNKKLAEIARMGPTVGRFAGRAW